MATAHIIFSIFTDPSEEDDQILNAKMFIKTFYWRNWCSIENSLIRIDMKLFIILYRKS